MLIALTGGTGFVGQRIVQQLQAHNHELRCLVREESDVSRLRRARVQLVYGDLDEPESLARLVDRADVVVHNAVWHDGPVMQLGRAQPFDHFDKNVMGSLKLLEIARNRSRQFIFISSGAVYGNPPGDAPLTEAFIRNPDTSYGAYKAAVEMFCQAYAQQFRLNACVLRPFVVVGLRDPVHESSYYDLVKQVVAGRTVEPTGGQKMVLVEDVARAVDLVIGRTDVQGEIYNLCDRWLSQREVARIAADIAGSDARIIEETEPARPRHEAPSDKIRGLGFDFGGETGLRNYLTKLIERIPREPAERTPT